MKAALYARVSTRDKEQDPETQMRVLRAYAEEEGFDSIEYVDRVSGGSMDRPAWQTMIKLVRRRRIKVVLVTHLDRATRNVKDGAAMLDEFIQLGVRFVPLETPEFDTSTPIGKAMAQMSLVFAELERARLPERIKMGQDRARAQGKTIGRPRKYPHITRAVATEAMVASENNTKAAAAALGIPASTLRDRLRWEKK